LQTKAVICSSILHEVRANALLGFHEFVTVGSFLRVAGRAPRAFLQFVVPSCNVSFRILAGAEHRCYTADITRTFPANGTFTPQQRDIYDLVLDMQLAALDAVKPGVAWADVQRSTRLLMLERLQQLGLVVKGSIEGLLEAGVDKLFMPHGLGHFLGLDVHDVSDVGPVPQQLQEGQVITVEPGGQHLGAAAVIWGCLGLVWDISWGWTCMMCLMWDRCRSSCRMGKSSRSSQVGSIWGQQQSFGDVWGWFGTFPGVGRA
jgi:hypothetical protein